MAGGRDYPFSVSPAELERIARQSARFAPATLRAFREAGLRPGMRVLDAGCGTGDSMRVAAELVGPTGAVVGVDRDPDVLAVARAQADATVELIQGDFRSTALPGLSGLGCEPCSAQPVSMMTWNVAGIRPLLSANIE